MQPAAPMTAPYAGAGMPVQRTLAAGEALFRSGDPVRQMFFVERGALRLQRNLADGRLVPMGRAAAGETVAEAALFSDCYHCDCVADIGGATVSGFARADVIAALHAAPGQGMALLRHLAAQVQGLRGRVALLSQHTAEARILAYLAQRADPATAVWPMDRTWKLVADEIGLTHEALYRALARLERAGHLVRRRRLVALCG
jgi:CRP-like cAMP-binding protein